MNNRKTATISPVIANLAHRENSPQLKLNLITTEEIPSDQNQSIAEEILKYLEKEKDAVSEVAVAAELEIGVPVARKHLKELGNRVENDGDDNWRIVECIDAEIVEECQHAFEFVPSPVELGFVECCSVCDAVKSIDGSEKLDELISWLSLQVEDFERQAQNTLDEREQAYYLDCANNKQQLISQVNRFKEKAISQEKEELLQIESELKEILDDFILSSSKRYQQIIDAKLYKSLGYNNFKVYCSERLGISYRQVLNLIKAASVINNLKNVTNLSQGIEVNHGSPLLLPTSERQCRILAKLKTPQEQYEAWSEAVESSNGKIPKLKILENLVKKRKQLVSNPVKDKISNPEFSSPKVERVIKYGKLTHGNMRLVSPKVMDALDKYIEENGIAEVDGAIARLLGLEDV